ncbi:hypothetical protein SKC41_29915 [Mycobacterium sp. 050128]|uniref:hypothetical protein n=1 Tax=Mycobacterium sp. 050128 TaxID=3096112 RepID=UPI002ED9EAC1
MGDAINGEDVTLVWTYAANCILYEEDGGPAELNIGSTLEPHLVSRSEAFRDLYAHQLLESLGAERDRITALARSIPLARRQSPSAEAVWSIAVDLCQRANAIIEATGAADDGRARRRLLAGTKHLNRTVVLGQWVPSYQVEIDNELLQELSAVDE